MIDPAQHRTIPAALVYDCSPTAQAVPVGREKAVVATLLKMDRALEAEASASVTGQMMSVSRTAQSVAPPLLTSTYQHLLIVLPLEHRPRDP